MEDDGQKAEIRKRNNGGNGYAQEAESLPDSISTIGASITITGDINSDEDLVIEGTVEGSVTCGTLIVGERGCVRGDIRTERLRLAGRVEGTIETSDLAIEATAHVRGDVTYSRLRVASGGMVSGQMNCIGEDGHFAEVAPARNGAAPARPVTVFEDPSYHSSREAMRNAAA